MLVSYEWLSEYVDLDGISPEDIAEELNRTGIEVEVIYTRDVGVEGVVVGEVLSVSKHPEADKLNVCMVDVGDITPLQIVCGAANVARGQRVPVALVGAKLPGGLRIKRAKLRGVESNGMICSAKELGLPDKVLMKEQTEGILVLGAEAPIGVDIKNYLGMNDQVIELQLTPNRADCLGMIGVAYEISAIFNRELRLPEVEIQTVYGKESRVEIVLEAEEDCPFYSAQVVHGLKIGPSPQWMQNRLISAGIRPINNIVDVTNYVMIETGQPLHAFDYQQIQNGKIVVRRARAGESVVTLDGVTRACDDETLLITDGNQVLGIAGIMGGESSEVTKHTTSILIEAAFFDPGITRRAARKLGLRSEASMRFEKGVDPERIIPALARAVQLLQQIAGGQVGCNIHAEHLGEIDDVVIHLRHERLRGLLGTQIEPEEVLDIFQRLKFPTKFNGEVYEVQVPTRRPDVTIEVDLIEEVARLYGYDRIPTTLPWGQQPPGGLTREQKLRRIVRHTLRDLGMYEVLTYSLTSSQSGKGLVNLNPNFHSIRLAMPMSQEHAVLRTSLVPSLIETAQYNLNHGNERINIFEIGKTYLTQEKKLTDLPEERWELAGLITGHMEPTIWKQTKPPGGDFFIAKGILEALFTRLGVEGIEYQEAFPVGYHPGRSAEIVLRGDVVGLLGQLHPRLANENDLGDTIVFQIDLAKLFAVAKDQLMYQAIPRFPAVTRDLALVVNQDVLAGEVEAGIREVAGELLESVTLFDVFTGSQVGEGKKSIAYSLVYRAMDRTLTDEEVALAHQRVVNYLEDIFEAKLR